MIYDPFGQSEYRCRLDWGTRGAAVAANRGDLIVIVDVLSFSSAVATAVHYGGFIIPCCDAVEAHAAAQSRPGVIEATRRDDSRPTAYSLSPSSFVRIVPGTTVALPSQNGAACSLLAGEGAKVYAGCLLNAEAVARRVMQHLSDPNANVTVVACGERWEHPHEDGCLRFAIEDYLGAGALLHNVPLLKSPEAEACASAFAAMQDRLAETLWNCGSGRELRKRGYPQDVEHASMLNMYASAPVLRHGQFELST